MGKGRGRVPTHLALWGRLFTLVAISSGHQVGVPRPAGPRCLPGVALALPGPRRGQGILLSSAQGWKAQDRREGGWCQETPRETGSGPPSSGASVASLSFPYLKRGSGSPSLLGLRGLNAVVAVKPSGADNSCKPTSPNVANKPLGEGAEDANRQKAGLESSSVTGQTGSSFYSAGHAVRCNSPGLQTCGRTAALISL